MVVHRAWPIAGLLLAGGIVGNGRAQAASYYVNAAAGNARDDNDGGAERPFLTFSRGVRDLKPGDALTIFAGVYRESVAIGVSGAPGNPITIQAAPGQSGKVVISGCDVVRGWRQEADPPNPPLWSADWKANFTVNYPTSWPEPGLLARHCEMAFANGEPLTQVLSRGDVLRGTFYVDTQKGKVYLAVRGKPNATPTVEMAVRQQGLTITQGHDLVIRGLTVTGVATPYDFGAYFLFRCRDVKLEDCRAEWNNLEGLHLDGHHLQAIGCVCSHNGGTGMTLMFANDCLLQDNTTNSNSWRYGPDWAAGGLKIVNGNPSHNRVIGHTACDNNGRGIWFDTGCRDNLVDRCYLHNNLIAGLEFEACLPGNVATHNVIDHTRLWKDAIYEEESGMGVTLYSSLGTTLANNTIVDNDQCGVWFAGGTRKIEGDEDAYTGRTRLFNNILAGNGVAGIRFWVWEKSAEKDVVAGNQSDYNLFWGKQQVAVILPGASGGSDGPADLDAWRKAFNQDAHSIWSDPQFAGSAMWGYGLAPGSPARHAGQPAQATGERPDLGAAQSGL